MSDAILVAEEPVAVLTVEAGPTSQVLVATERTAALQVVAEQGLAGRDGKDGAGADTTVPFYQVGPSTSWIIAHGLGRYPSLTLVDSAGDLFDADVRYVDANTIVVTLIAPTAGTAYLN